MTERRLKQLSDSIAIGIPAIWMALMVTYGTSGWRLPVYDGGTLWLASFFIWLPFVVMSMQRYLP